MSTKKIDIDIETYKLIESLRSSFEESQNDIIKRVLKENSNSNKTAINPFSDINISQNIFNNSKGLFWKEVLLPNGLKLRKISKDITYSAVVLNGRIICNNREYFSPSAAATDVFGTTVNGWLFWEYFDEKKEEWYVLNNLRKNKL
ncbi:MAG: hypothetical protein U0T69_08415 [Chitinophagales bacterium]